MTPFAPLPLSALPPWLAQLLPMPAAMVVSERPRC